MEYKMQTFKPGIYVGYYVEGRFRKVSGPYNTWQIAQCAIESHERDERHAANLRKAYGKVSG